MHVCVLKILIKLKHKTYQEEPFEFVRARLQQIGNIQHKVQLDVRVADAYDLRDKV